MSFQEHALRNTAVELFFFSNLNRVILKEKTDFNLSDSFLFNGSLDGALLEVAVEPEDMFVELDEGGLEPRIKAGN